jgi:hypothetical protein
MLLVAAVIALEKLIPKPEPIVRLSGIVALMAGMALTIRALL